MKLGHVPNALKFLLHCISLILFKQVISKTFREMMQYFRVEKKTVQEKTISIKIESLRKYKKKRENKTLSTKKGNKYLDDSKRKLINLKAQSKQRPFWFQYRLLWNLWIAVGHRMQTIFIPCISKWWFMRFLGWDENKSKYFLTFGGRIDFSYEKVWLDAQQVDRLWSNAPPFPFK